MMRRVPSVDKLFALTGFRPQTPLTEIIDRVTQSFRVKQEHPAEFHAPLKVKTAHQGGELLS
jgi:hypothetical protein